MRSPSAAGAARASGTPDPRRHPSLRPARDAGTAAASAASGERKLRRRWRERRGHRAHPLLLSLLLVLLAGGAPAAAQPSAATQRAGSAESEQAWDLLRSLRASLRAQSPLTATFRQTFVPADFDEGETEEGVLAIALPKCMRWDYLGDFAKSFLLCDDWAYTWNPGEPKGRRTRIDDELALEAPGLDFFLLSIDLLRQRYSARIAPRVGGEAPGDRNQRLQLLPLVPTPEVARLDVVLDAEARVVLSLSYADAEGSRTTFELSNYETGAKAGTFAPPATLDWEDS